MVRLETSADIHGHKPGFTLFETLIYVMIMSTVTIGIILMVGEMFKIHAKVRSAYILDDSIQYAKHRIVYAVQNGYDIVAPATGTAGWLRIQMSTDSADTIDFALTDGQMTMSARNEAPVWITSREVRITSLSFQRLQGISPAVRFEVQGSMGDVDPVYQAEDSISGTVSIHK